MTDVTVNSEDPAPTIITPGNEGTQVNITSDPPAQVSVDSDATPNVTIDSNAASSANSQLITTNKNNITNLQTLTAGHTTSINTNTNNITTLTATSSSNSTNITEMISVTGNATGLLSTATGLLSNSTGINKTLVDSKMDNAHGTGSGVFVYEHGNFRINATGGNKTSFDLVGGKMQIRPKRGVGLHVKSSSAGNVGVRIKSDGPVELAHDLFKNAGVSGGFADNSNHFHDITTINRISQSEAELSSSPVSANVMNLERLQEKYYAIENNLVRRIRDTDSNSGKAAFINKHRVTRALSTNGVVAPGANNFVSDAELNVSDLQNSSFRAANRQVFFSSTTTRRTEAISGTFSGTHGLSPNDIIRVKIGTAFEGPIVAATLFGLVTETGNNTTPTDSYSAEFVLYGGNYKSTSEVPLGNTMTQLQHGFEIELITNNSRVNAGDEQVLQVVSGDYFNPPRDYNETVSVTFSTPHDLKRNESVTIFTPGIGLDKWDIFSPAYVLDPDPSGGRTGAHLVYGRLINQEDLIGEFTNSLGLTVPSYPPLTGTWFMHRGSVDGIHQETLGDQLYTFFANNSGTYENYQIGPGCQTDSNCISIGQSVYNNESGTVKIGYDNEMLNITSAGISTTGTVNISGDLTVSGNLTVEGTGLYLPNIPTSNPGVAGQIYSDGGTLKISS